MPKFTSVDLGSSYSASLKDAEYSFGIRSLLKLFTKSADDPRLVRWSSLFENRRGKEVKIALLDSGINWQEKVFRESNLVCRDFTGAGSMADNLGHGTKNASLLLGGEPKFEALLPDATLLVCKVLGAGSKLVARGLNWTISSDVQIIIMPFGHLGPNRDIDLHLAEASKRGILIFAAAGNRGADALLYPASSIYSASVTGANMNGQILRDCYAGEYIDYIAPGEIPCPLDGSIMYGSSPATVLAAGIAALALS